MGPLRRLKALMSHESIPMICVSRRCKHVRWPGFQLLENKMLMQILQTRCARGHMHSGFIAAVWFKMKCKDLLWICDWVAFQRVWALVELADTLWYTGHQTYHSSIMFFRRKCRRGTTSQMLRTNFWLMVSRKLVPNGQAGAKSQAGHDQTNINSDIFWTSTWILWVVWNRGRTRTIAT